MEFSRRSVLGSIGVGTLGASFAPSALAQSFPSPIQHDPRAFILPEPTRTPLPLSPGRRHRNAPVLETDLYARRVDIGLDLSDLDSPVIVGDYDDADLTMNYDPASLTKCITAMVVTDFLRQGTTAHGHPVNMDTFIPVLGNEKSLNPRGSDRRYGNLSGVLSSMNAAKVSTLMDMLLVGSRNGAAMTLGRYMAGGYTDFVDLMNHKTREIGMANSFFINPSGLPANQDGMSNFENFNNVVCIEDLARMMVYMHKNYPELDNITSKPGYELPGLRSHFNAQLVNMAPPTNPLYREYDTENEYARRTNVIGTKSGYTRNSGYCLICTADPDEDTKIISITTGNASGGRGVASKQILDATYEGIRAFRRNEIVRDCSSEEEAQELLGSMAQDTNLGVCLDNNLPARKLGVGV